MSFLQWIPMIATLGLIYLLRWSHIGVTNFKVFVLILIGWALFLIFFYRWQSQDQTAPDEVVALEAGMGDDD